jgi:dTDP-4-dehydrorhamnose reductase
MTTRVLLLGKNGQVGWELRRTLALLGPIVAVDVPEIDLADTGSLRRLVQETRPDVIVNAAAYTAVDKAEREPEHCAAVNGVAPGMLAALAAETGALFVHYSTDYVYDGRKTGPYLETDTPGPLNVYGRTKLAGDEAVQRSGADHLIFRLCWVYGTRGRNFLLTIMRLARECQTLRVVHDQVGAPTWSRMIAEATALVLSKALATKDRARLSGIYHLSAFGQTSWHGFAQRIVELMPGSERKCKEVVPIAAADYPVAAQRPKNSVLSNEKFQRTFGLQLPHWEEGLKLALDRV